NAAEKMRDLAQANEEAAGVAERNAKIMAGPLQGAMRGRRSAIEELFLSVGSQGLAGGLQGWVGPATDAVRILAGMEDRVEGNVKAARTLATVLQAIGVTLAAVMAVKIIAWFVSLAAAIMGAVNALVLLNVALILPTLKFVAIVAAI